MRLRAILCAGVLVATGTAVTVEPAVAAPGDLAAAVHLDLAPAARVHPSRGLTPQTFQILKGSGLPPDTEVRIVQCDQPSYEVDGDVLGCPAARTVRSTPDGTVNEQVYPSDPVYRSLEYGDPVPVYCRADICRYHLEWRDPATGELRSVAGNLMYFTGSPATIAVSPATGLTDGQMVTVTGTAKGSRGRYVTISQASCFQLVQGSGCTGQLPLASVRLRADGTFRVRVPVYRYLADLQDCVGAFYGCRLVVTVLDPDGRPDDSFGVSALGDAGAHLELVS
ncbi:hypothetical protein [Catellatospora sp. NPDC049609]|uniref:hypothetical protein n=1 Tax=Catellatospora sp. NPDC049609 TaxID=3155505 RepID=UPI00344606C5